MIEEKEIKEQEEIISGWINDVNIRIEAGKRFGNNKNKNIENRKDILDATIKKKENDNNKDEIEKQLREEVKRLQEFINNKEKAAQ